jgi:hypothetical protein
MSEFFDPETAEVDFDDDDELLDDDEFDNGEGDEYEDALANCGMLPDGTCVKAGSEECDWECPFSE